MVLSPGEQLRALGLRRGPLACPEASQKQLQEGCGLSTSLKARRGEAPALSRLVQAASVPGILAPGRSLGMGSPWALTVSRVSSEGRTWPQCSPSLPVHLCLPSTAPSQAYVHCCPLRGPVL